MKKSDALKLRRGDLILFGDRMHTAKCNYTIEGEVLCVSPRGGIRIRTDGGGEQWTSYHLVQWAKRRSRLIPAQS